MCTINQLKAIVAFYEEHPGLPLPLLPNMIYILDQETALACAKLPKARKEYDPQWLNIKVPVDDFEMIFFIARNTVCTAVKTETTVKDARPAHTYEKVVEWKCHPLLELGE